MKYAVDLHIHSALSPCADDEMTPNNIVNMSKLKGLDIISVTDHNSGANLEAVRKCAEKSGLLFVPGLEIETSEEVHLVCLLPDTEHALHLHSCVMQTLPGLLNREDIFGRQLLVDETDRVTGKEDRMLITASSLTVNEVYGLVKQLHGAVIPAHVDRTSYSILSNLGMIPSELKFKTLEISRQCDTAAFARSRPELDGYFLFKSSDAHTLGDILERESWLDLEELTAKAVIRALAG